MIKFNQKYDRWVTDTGIVYRQDNTGAFIVCKQSDKGNGYSSVFTVKPKRANILVHRLVFETFKGEIPEGNEIDHINTVKNDNRLSNLRCVTHKENLNNTITREHKSKSLLGNTNKRGKTYSEFGIKFKEHFGITQYQNMSLYKREYAWYYRNNKVCSWEVDNEKC